MPHGRAEVGVSTENEELMTRRTIIAQSEDSALCSIFEEPDYMMKNKNGTRNRDIGISRSDEHGQNIVDARHTWYDSDMRAMVNVEMK